MPGKSPLLYFAIGVITKASILLEMENEGSHLADTYFGDIRTQTNIAEEIMKVGYASDDNGYGIGAFTFGLGTDRVARHQT